VQEHVIIRPHDRSAEAYKMGTACLMFVLARPLAWKHYLPICMRDRTGETESERICRNQKMRVGCFKASSVPAHACSTIDTGALVCCSCRSERYYGDARFLTGYIKVFTPAISGLVTLLQRLHCSKILNIRSLVLPKKLQLSTTYDLWKERERESC